MLRLFARLILGDFRRHPWLHLWLLAGLVLAGALLTGVEALNSAARDSFDRAEGGITPPYKWRVHSLLPAERLDQHHWLALRRAGIAADPVLQQRLQLGDEQWVRIKGTTLPARDLDGWVTLVDPQLAQQQGWRPGQVLESQTGAVLPPLKFQSDLGPWLMMDIGQAARVLETGRALDHLEIPSLTPAQQNWLRHWLGPDLALQSLSQQGDNTLLSAFSFNLTALSLLSFLVGLLLAFHALERLVQHRLHNIAVLHRLGITRRQWLSALAAELALWALLAGLLGSVVGIVLAQELGPGVADTLVSLYGMEQGLALHWTLRHGLFCTLVLFLALVLMLAWLLRPAAARRRLWRWLLPPVVVAVLALHFFARSQNQALLLTGLTLVLAVLLMPALLKGAAVLGARRAARWPAHLGWGLWDLADASRRLVIPIMAITLALGSAIATRVLVGSFEHALTGFLDQRLHADLYFYAEHEQLLDYAPWLAAQPAVEVFQGRTQRDGTLNGQPVNLKAYTDTGLRWDFITLKQAETNWWPQTLEGAGCLVNEPLALHQGLKLGQLLEFGSGNARLPCTLVGVFFDYGNPHGEMLTVRQTLLRHFGDAPLDGYSLVLAPGTAPLAFADVMHEELGVPRASVLAQSVIRTQADGLFRRTFAITDALAWLTLLVALGSWLTSLAAQQQGWVRQQAVVSALGMTSRQIAAARMLQLVVQFLVISLAAVAVGLVLGWQLIALVNPLSFGWSMPVQWWSGDWWRWLLVANALVLAAAWGPVWWQSRRSVAGQLSREAA